MRCMECGSIVSSLLDTCPICGDHCNGLVELRESVIERTVKAIPTKNIKNENKDCVKVNNKIYTLACKSKANSYDEQETYLIDEDRKIKMYFYSDGYDGVDDKCVKSILDFLGIKYFECVYSNFPEKYREYETYNICGELLKNCF